VDNLPVLDCEWQSTPHILPPAGQPPSQPPTACQPLNAGQPPSQPLNAGQPPSQPLNVLQLPSQPLNAGQPPIQPPNVSQPPIQPPTACQLPSQPLNVLQPPSQPPTAGQLPSQPLNVLQPPIQPPTAGQPPSQPPIQQPYIVPPFGQLPIQPPNILPTASQPHVGHSPYWQDPQTPQPLVSDLSKYLIKKELLIARFSCFNDQPGSYPTWKASFQCIVADLGMGQYEELDLLVKVLGPVSSAQANSMRSANPSDPGRAIRQIWIRLDERYGRPEMVEASLRQRLAKIARIFDSAGYTRMYDLLDIASGIESLQKDTRYRALLGYFDTSVGVNSVLVKLPQFIQNKWLDRAAKHKKTNSVAYPPFSVFVELLAEMCSRCNDPGLVVPSVPQPSRRFHVLILAQ